MWRIGLISAIVAMTACGDDDRLPWEPETPVCLLPPHCEGTFLVEEDDYYDIHSRVDCTAPTCRDGVVSTCTGCANGSCTGCETAACPSGACNAARDGCADVATGAAPEPAVGASVQ